MPEQTRSASRSSVSTLSPPRETPGGTGAGTARRPSADEPDSGDPSSQETALRLKCPYLAGRPPHGSHHVWPSGVNVCYARPREEKPYGQVSKETQAARCFCGTEPFERCPDFERAHAREIALPVFAGHAPERPSAAAESGAGRQLRRKRVKHRHRRSPLQRWLKENGRAALICAGWVVVALLAFSLILRSM